MPNLGATIKAFRKKANLTQAQLADKLGTTKAAISRYESGKRTPRYDQIIQIAEALQISPTLLIGYEIHDLEDCSYAVINSDRLDTDILLQLVGQQDTKDKEISLFFKTKEEQDSFLHLVQDGSAYSENLKRLITAFNRLNFIGQSMLISQAETLAQYSELLGSIETDKLEQQI